MLTTNYTNSALPNYVHPLVRSRVDDLTLIDDLTVGTRRMWDRSPHYIRKWDGESPATYEIRRQCETLFGGFERTVTASVGMLFAKAPTVAWETTEAELEPLWQNIDAAGTHGAVFAKQFAELAIRDGMATVLVDHPSAPVDEQGAPIAITAANEVRYNMRPRWAMYARGALINYASMVVNNHTQHALMVFEEEAHEVTGYGTSSRPRYRVLRLLVAPDGPVATWQVFDQIDEHGNKPESFNKTSEGVFRNRAGAMADVLPVAIAHTGRPDGVLSSSIPLMPVAWANLAYWQIATNLRFNRDVCGFEQFVVEGELLPDPITNMRPTTVKIGPLSLINVEKGGNAKWISPAGTGLEQLEKARLEKLTEIAQQGVAFLAHDTRAAETAEAKRIDASAERGTLATCAQACEDALNYALEHTAWYRGIERDNAPTVNISREYETTGMPPALMTAWVGAIANAGLPVRLLLQAMRASGLIASEEDLDALEQEILVNQEAKADQDRLSLDQQQQQQQPEPQRPRSFRIERGADGRVAAVAEA